MPKVYLHPAQKAQPGPYVTHYQVFVGPGAAFEGVKGVSLDDFPDGLSNTILIVEAAEPVPWTKPQDLPYDPHQPLPRLGGLSRRSFNVALGDRSVRFVPTEVSERSLRAAITRNGGEPRGDIW
jgi:hypothetical protein